MKTTIEWCDHSINPIRARSVDTGAVGHYCEKIAAGCTNCYASALQRRFGTPSFGSGQHRNLVDLFLDESKLDEVRRRKKPTKYFWCDMTDMFGDWVHSEWIAKCLSTMDETPQHWHLLLTKRPGNVPDMWVPRFDYAADRNDSVQCIRHRTNVALLTSISDQATADELIPQLLRCRDLVPVLGLSVEPLLSPVDLPLDGISWVIVGGESGPHARPCNVAWIRDIVAQCREANVPVFVKQLGSRPVDLGTHFDWTEGVSFVRDPDHGNGARVLLEDKKGGDWNEWPEDLRVREFPAAFYRQEVQA